MLLQIVMGITFSIQLFLLARGAYPYEAAVTLCNAIGLHCGLAWVVLELWGLASTCPTRPNDKTNNKATLKIWISWRKEDYMRLYVCWNGVKGNLIKHTRRSGFVGVIWRLNVPLLFIFLLWLLRKTCITLGFVSDSVPLRTWWRSNAPKGKHSAFVTDERLF